jgi:hypothetical protein
MSTADDLLRRWMATLSFDPPQDIDLENDTYAYLQTRTHDQGTDGGYSLQYCTMCGQPKPLLALGQQWDQWEGVRICQQCHDGYREDMGDEAPALSAQPPAPSGEALREAAQGFVDALLEEGYDGNRKRLHGELMKLTSQLAQPSETP